jgi:UDP-N-acetylmuramate dehydrogenase
VGAYGQEVSDTVESVVAMDRGSYRISVFKNSDCRFSYRDSIFKSGYKNRYVILQVKYRLKKDGEPELKYKELIDFTGTIEGYKSFNNTEKLKAVRESVLTIRGGKSMVSSETDNNTFSCGSFFTNPVISGEKLADFNAKCLDFGLKPVIFENNGLFKTSAAWLIENAGFSKGYTENGVGISEKHTLALVNRGGTTKNLLDLAENIRETVYKKFNIELLTEPEIIKS